MTTPQRLQASVWQTLWKVNQIVIPLSVTWAIWVTKNVYEVQSHISNDEVFTLRHGVELKADFDAKIAALPPPEWRQRIVATEAGLAAHNIQFARVEALLEDIRSRMVRWEEEQRKQTAN